MTVFYDFMTLWLLGPPSYYDKLKLFDLSTPDFKRRHVWTIEVFKSLNHERDDDAATVAGCRLWRPDLYSVPY